MRSSTVTVVLPLYKCATTVAPLIEQLRQALDDRELHIVAVDDADPEHSAAVARDTAAAIEIPIRVITHTRNRGQHAAIVSGLRAADRGLTVVMDADLQDPPEAAAELVKAVEAGAAVAFGRRPRLEGRSSRWFKRWFVLRMTPDLPPEIGLFFAVSPEAHALLASIDPHRPFVLGEVLALDGLKVAVPYDRAASSAVSGYTGWKRSKLGIRALVWLARHRSGVSGR